MADGIEKSNGNLGAFACLDDRDYLQPGLTKREYLAAQALTGLIANSFSPSVFDITPTERLKVTARLAKAAVNIADATLEELDKKPMV